MDNAKRGLLELLRQFEIQFKEVKQEYKDNLHLDAELKRLSIPAKYKGPIQKLLDDQENVLSGRRMVSFKCALNLILITFANYNEEVNGFADEVARILMKNIGYNAAEDNVANQLHSNDEEMIPSLTRLSQLVTPDPEQNANNRSEVLEPPVHVSKEDILIKRLPLEPATCLVRDCGKQFDYRGIPKDHIEKYHKNILYYKDHQNVLYYDTKLQCALCHKDYILYRHLYHHYREEHAYSYQCAFPSCAFTSKTTIQVRKHFEESHVVSAIVNNHEGNSKETVNVQPINQGSTAAVASRVASVSDGPNELPVVQQPSTSVEPKTMKRTVQSNRNNEECIYKRKCVDGQAQSSASLKKAKLDSARSNNAPSVDQSRHRCIIEHCASSYDYLDDLEQHIKLAHSHPNQLAITTLGNILTTVQNSNAGKRPIVSLQSSISTESSISTHIEVPLRSRQESRDSDECIDVDDDVDDQGQSSSLVKKAKLNATRSDDAQVTSQSKPNAKDNATKEGPQLLNTDDMAIFIGLECFQSNCKLMSNTKEELNHHLWERHCIRAFPCLLKDCGQSFDDMPTLTDHYKNDHKNTTKWQCAKCWGHYHCQHDLFKHNVSFHTSRYKCTFSGCKVASCQAVATCRHYVQRHMISCGKNDCANKPNAYKLNFYRYSNGLKHYHYI